MPPSFSSGMLGTAGVTKSPSLDKQQAKARVAFADLEILFFQLRESILVCRNPLCKALVLFAQHSVKIQQESHATIVYT